MPVSQWPASPRSARAASGAVLLCIDAKPPAGDKPLEWCYSSAPKDFAGKGLPMTVHTGRHFLQIPGPTNIPDRVLRAMDMPGLDHRGPEFAEIGFAVLAGMQRMFKNKG